MCSSSIRLAAISKQVVVVASSSSNSSGSIKRFANSA